MAAVRSGHDAFAYLVSAFHVARILVIQLCSARETSRLAWVGKIGSDGAPGVTEGVQGMECAAIVLAAGMGARADGGTGEAKQFRRLAGRPVLARSLAPFLGHPAVTTVQVVLRRDAEPAYRAAVARHPRLRSPVAGGDRRQDSVRLGLEALADAAPSHVLIHDAARPFVTPGLIDRVIAALKTHRAAVPGLPVSDTLKRAGEGGIVAETVARERLFAVQTPQGFRFSDILAAHRRAAATAIEFTDDAAVAEWSGLDVALVEGEAGNRKLTTREDFVLAEALLSRREFRTGTGFDVHRFGPGERVILCGVPVAHPRALTGHSDADVGLHAITDALLGSIAAGDIGSHFPPAQEEWRGADSAYFLAHARDMLTARGGTIVNVDVTLICEQPKIGPHRDAMRARIAEILAMDVARVAVKATTTEGLGFTGRGEGIAAQAAVSVAFPEA